MHPGRSPDTSPSDVAELTMQRISPDRASLEIAHRALHTDARLDEMLEHPALKIILEVLARRHMQRRARIDVKKLQANDHT
jgi:hypothetical protein